MNEEGTISWSRGEITTEGGVTLPVWVLKQHGRKVLVAVSEGLEDAVSKEYRQLIGELLASVS